MRGWRQRPRRIGHCNHDDGKIKHYGRAQQRGVIILPPRRCAGRRRRGLTSLRVLRVLGLGVAVVSSLLGAVLAVLPALVVGFVTLFYNSAGGALIFLGNLIGLLPNPYGAAGGAASLPVFQQLDTHAGAVVLGSVVATILCSMAAAVIVISMQGRGGWHWLAVGLCCVAASIAGGRAVMLCVIPAIAISLGHLTRQHLHRR